jgi:hypothetical protein
MASQRNFQFLIYPGWPALWKDGFKANIEKIYFEDSA